MNCEVRSRIIDKLKQTMNFSEDQNQNREN